LSIGAGGVAPSAESDLLSADGGYGGLRAWVATDAAWLPLSFLGVGGWIALSTRTSPLTLQQTAGPTLNEFDGFLGPIVFLYTNRRRGAKHSLNGYFGVRAGAAVGTLSFGPPGPAMTAPVWGIEGGLRFDMMGVSLGFLSAQTRVPSGLGLNYDMGGLYFWINGYVSD
jgi:hypothetical protein